MSAPESFGGGVRVPESPCPWCGHAVDGAAAIAEVAAPRPGDLSVCIRCAGLMSYGPDLQLQKLERTEFCQLSLEVIDDLKRTQWAILQANRGTLG